MSAATGDTPPESEAEAGAAARPPELISGLATEGVRPELDELDALSAEEIVRLMCADVFRVPEALAAAAPSLAAAVDTIVDRLASGGRLIYVGAGTAGRVGMLDAAEAGPTFNSPPGQIVAVLAGGSGAFVSAVENLEDDVAAGVAAMGELAVSPADVVVGISASGRTPYVLGALAAANAAGASTVGVACNAASPLSEAAGIAIEVLVGPEIVAGSTRLNAGSAQKAVLNILSTASMIRLGKTYGNLMVDLRATNDKLRDRAARIVVAVTGASVEEALAALERSRWRPKVAIVLLARGLDPVAAEELVVRSGGRLRTALEAPAPEVDLPSTRRRPRAPRRLGVAAAVVGGALVRGDVEIEEGRVVAVGLPGGGVGIAAPGLIDLQVNGYAGVAALTGSLEELEAMSEALLRTGVIAFQPTLVTAEPAQSIQALARLERLRRPSPRRARVLGVHLEGPFLSPKRPGIHPLELLRPPDEALLSALLAAGPVTMVTLAPELPGALALIAVCRRRGVVVSLGHTAASAAEAEAGFAAGARAVTHLFNAMPPLAARVPGLAAVALARDDVAIQLIADGTHVSDPMIRLAFAAAGRRCSLVSDVLSAGGSAEATARLGDVRVAVHEGSARRADGTIAGALAALPVGLAHLVGMGFPLEEAVQAVTERPARILGGGGGRLLPGCPADLVVLDDAGLVERVVLAGREVERA